MERMQRILSVGMLEEDEKEEEEEEEGNGKRKAQEMVSFRLPVDTNGKSISELNPSKWSLRWMAFYCCW